MSVGDDEWAAATHEKKSPWVVVRDVVSARAATNAAPPPYKAALRLAPVPHRGGRRTAVEPLGSCWD